MQKVHSNDPLEVALVKKENEFLYCKLETNGFVRIMDSAKGVKTVSFTNIDETQQKGLAFSIESGPFTEVQRLIFPPSGSIHPKHSIANPEHTTSQIDRSELGSINPNILWNSAARFLCSKI